MKLMKRHLTGKEHLSTITDLLQRIRLEGAHEGLYEAADLQWWWRLDDAPFPDRQTYWFNSRGDAVACLLLYDADTEWNNDFIYLPSARRTLEEYVIPEVVAAISHTDKVSTISVREDDLVLQNALTAAGFVKDDVAMVQTELVNAPAQRPLALGFRVTSRVEDEMPHHLIKRNGNEVALKLSECSLYRPELDLCVRNASGNVAAYALFWMDDVTKVGLLEPLRTEREFQRMGLASHLIAEGISRLRDLGAESIRVTYGTDNEAAVNLYHQSGFEDRIMQLEFRRGSS